MKIIKVGLPSELSKIRIVPLGDVHRGSAQFNEKMFLETVKFIEQNDDVYTLLMGDLIDNALKTSKSDVYAAVEKPQDSMQWVIDHLRPIASKILACTSGNHEDRTNREAGMDLTWWLADCLGIKERYSNDSFILFVSFGNSYGRHEYKRTFSIYAYHGAGAGVTIQGAAKKLSDMGTVVVNADVYVMGHTHKPVMFPDARIVVNHASKTYKMVEPLYVNGTAFLNFEGGYGEKKGFRPSSTRMPLITLSLVNREKRVGVIME